MAPPPNPLGTTGTIDNTLCGQHCSEAEVPAEETRSLLQMIQEQVVLDVDAETADRARGRTLATEGSRYTRALELQAQLAEEAVGQFQDGSHPDEQHLHAIYKAWAACWAVDSRHPVHNVGLTGDTCHINPSNGGPQRAQQPAMSAGPEPVRLYHNPTRTIRQLRERSTALTDGHGILEITDGS
jgi:hypothetical protein